MREETESPSSNLKKRSTGLEEISMVEIETDSQFMSETDKV